MAAGAGDAEAKPNSASKRTRQSPHGMGPNKSRRNTAPPAPVASILDTLRQSRDPRCYDIIEHPDYRKYLLTDMVDFLAGLNNIPDTALSPLECVRKYQLLHYRSILEDWKNTAQAFDIPKEAEPQKFLTTLTLGTFHRDFKPCLFKTLDPTAKTDFADVIASCLQGVLIDGVLPETTPPLTDFPRVLSSILPTTPALPTMPAGRPEAYYPQLRKTTPRKQGSWDHLGWNSLDNTPPQFSLYEKICHSPYSSTSLDIGKNRNRCFEQHGTQEEPLRMGLYFKLWQTLPRRIMLYNRTNNTFSRPFDADDPHTSNSSHDFYHSLHELFLEQWLIPHLQDVPLDEILARLGAPAGINVFEQPKGDNKIVRQKGATTKTTQDQTRNAQHSRYLRAIALAAFQLEMLKQAMTEQVGPELAANYKPIIRMCGMTARKALSPTDREKAKAEALAWITKDPYDAIEKGPELLLWLTPEKAHDYLFRTDLTVIQQQQIFQGIQKNPEVYLWQINRYHTHNTAAPATIIRASEIIALIFPSRQSIAMMRANQLTLSPRPPTLHCQKLQLNEHDYLYLRQLGYHKFMGVHFHHTLFRQGFQFIGTPLQPLLYHQASFKKASLVNALFRQVKLHDATFEAANLTGAVFDHTTLITGPICFNRTNLTSVQWCNTDPLAALLDNPIQRPTPQRITVDGAIFDQVSFDCFREFFTLKNFPHCTLRAIAFRHCPGLTLTGADLRGSTFDAATCDNINITGATLDQVAFDSLVTNNVRNFSGCTFDHVNLHQSGLTITGATLIDCTITAADWIGAANTQKLKPNRATLIHLLTLGVKDFDGYDLSGVDLSGLDLSGVSFKDALLQGIQCDATTRLAGALLSKTQLDDAAIIALSAAGITDFSNNIFVDVSVDVVHKHCTRVPLTNAILRHRHLTEQSLAAFYELEFRHFQHCIAPVRTSWPNIPTDWMAAPKPRLCLREVTADHETFESLCQRVDFPDSDLRAVDLQRLRLIYLCDINDSRFTPVAVLNQLILNWQQLLAFRAHGITQLTNCTVLPTSHSLLDSSFPTILPADFTTPSAIEIKTVTNLICTNVCFYPLFKDDAYAQLHWHERYPKFHERYLYFIELDSCHFSHCHFTNSTARPDPIKRLFGMPDAPLSDHISGLFRSSIFDRCIFNTLQAWFLSSTFSGSLPSFNHTSHFDHQFLSQPSLTLPARLPCGIDGMGEAPLAKLFDITFDPQNTKLFHFQLTWEDFTRLVEQGCRTFISCTVALDATLRRLKTRDTITFEDIELTPAFLMALASCKIHAAFLRCRLLLPEGADPLELNTDLFSFNNMDLRRLSPESIYRLRSASKLKLDSVTLSKDQLDYLIHEKGQSDLTFCTPATAEEADHGTLTDCTLHYPFLRSFKGQLQDCMLELSSQEEIHAFLSEPETLIPGQFQNGTLCFQSDAKTLSGGGIAPAQKFPQLLRLGFCHFQNIDLYSYGPLYAPIWQRELPQYLPADPSAISFTNTTLSTNAIRLLRNYGVYRYQGCLVAYAQPPHVLTATTLEEVDAFLATHTDAETGVLPVAAGAGAGAAASSTASLQGFWQPTPAHRAPQSTMPQQSWRSPPLSAGTPAGADLTQSDSKEEAAPPMSRVPQWSSVVPPRPLPNSTAGTAVPNTASIWQAAAAPAPASQSTSHPHN